jgi:dTDP-glucose 4,6-dehydratase
MRHIIIGGDGFVGRHLAQRLADLGESVVIGDIVKSPIDIYARVPFVEVDVTRPETLERLTLKPGDMIYNLSARMLSPLQPRHKRREFFWPVNTTGVEHILTWMEAKGATRLVHYTTDMVYGHSKTVPQTEDHPVAPLGEYGQSKLVTEQMCQVYREKGFRISIFRPRLIIGPGRLGILAKLFTLVDMNLPVPMIGSGRNPYQFVSVFDCAEAAYLAWVAGVPNSTYNIGSDDPPAVRDLLARLVKEAGSRSFLLPTPAPLVKLTLGLLDRLDRPLMDPEQYLIADEVCLLDCSRAKREIGWRPRFKDDDMLIAAYREYRAGRAAARENKAATVAAAR